MSESWLTVERPERLIQFSHEMAGGAAKGGKGELACFASSITMANGGRIVVVIAEVGGGGGVRRRRRPLQSPRLCLPHLNEGGRRIPLRAQTG